jgi:LysM repeat protein
MAGVLMPIAPQKLQLKITNKNKTIDLLNGGEANILKYPGLTEISFDLTIPAQKYPFSVYEKGFKPVSHYLNLFEKLKNSRRRFSFLVLRSKTTQGKTAFTKAHDTNIKVALEEYTTAEEWKDGFDTMVSVKLKQAPAYGTQKLPKPKPKTQKSTPAAPVRTTPTVTSVRTHTVVRGDCLWNLARKYYGSGAKETLIFNANRDKIKNKNLIYPGQVFTIPPDPANASGGTAAWKALG